MSRAPKRVTSQIGDPLTAEQAQELLRDAKLLAADEQLPAEVSAKLVQRLNVVHYFFAVDEAIRPANAAKRKVIATLAEARRALATVAEHERKFLASAEAAAAFNPNDTNASLSAAAKREHLAEIAAIDCLLTNVTGSPVLEPRYSTGRHQRWGAQADLMFDALNEALSSIGKPTIIGAGYDGPAGRFLAKTLPLLTGAHPSVGAAAKGLQRRRTPAPKKDGGQLHSR